MRINLMTCFTGHKLTLVAAFFKWCDSCRQELRIRTQFVCALLVGAVTGTWILASTSDAATWDGGGGDGNWTTAANWAGDTAPVAGDLLQFGGTTNLLTNNNFATNTLFGGVDFLAGAGSFTLGGNAMLLGGNINNNSGANQTVQFNTATVTSNAV